MRAREHGKNPNQTPSPLLHHPVFTHFDLFITKRFPSAILIFLTKPSDRFAVVFPFFSGVQTFRLGSGHMFCSSCLQRWPALALGRVPVHRRPAGPCQHTLMRSQCSRGVTMPMPTAVPLYTAKCIYEHKPDGRRVDALSACSLHYQQVLVPGASGPSAGTSPAAAVWARAWIGRQPRGGNPQTYPQQLGARASLKFCLFTPEKRS